MCLPPVSQIRILIEGQSHEMSLAKYDSNREILRL
jgi:hypothetical protein